MNTRHQSGLHAVNVHESNVQGSFLKQLDIFEGQKLWPPPPPQPQPQPEPLLQVQGSCVVSVADPHSH
jgi:hypothetical protein